MQRNGLTPTYYIITLLGYAVMVCIYAIFLRYNLKQYKYGLIFGSALILYGYILLFYEYYEERSVAINEEKQLHIDKTENKKAPIINAEQNIFRFVEFELVITAILGHFMVYNDIYLTFGYVLLLTYYVLYLIRNYKDADKYFVNKLQVVGASMLIYHFVQDIKYMLTL